MLFISAQYDHGLIPQTRELYHLLFQGRRCPKLDWIVVQDVNHFSAFYFWDAQHYRILDHVLHFLDYE